jgi:hypothetical protein
MKGYGQIDKAAKRELAMIDRRSRSIAVQTRQHNKAMTQQAADVNVLAEEQAALASIDVQPPEATPVVKKDVGVKIAEIAVNEVKTTSPIVAKDEVADAVKAAYEQPKPVSEVSTAATTSQDRETDKEKLLRFDQPSSDGLKIPDHGVKSEQLFLIRLSVLRSRSSRRDFTDRFGLLICGLNGVSHFILGDDRRSRFNFVDGDFGDLDSDVLLHHRRSFRRLHVYRSQSRLLLSQNVDVSRLLGHRLVVLPSLNGDRTRPTIDHRKLTLCGFVDLTISLHGSVYASLLRQDLL